MTFPSMMALSLEGWQALLADALFGKGKYYPFQKMSHVPFIE